MLSMNPLSHNHSPSSAFSLLRFLTIIALLWSFCVVSVGAYTRLTHAGLGCPDWPGCYGAMRVDLSRSPILADQLERVKAHTEMGHRYIAGLLALLIVALCIASWRTPYRLWACSLLCLILLQASFGRWTVTYRLAPVVVLGHLILGFSTVVMLWIGTLSLRTRAPQPWPTPIKAMGIVLICFLVLQIILGGWMSANYAATACTDFPTCGSLEPVFSWNTEALSNAFVRSWVWVSGLYPHDLLTLQTIHMVHRLGAALLSILCLGWMGLLWRFARGREALMLLAVLALQLSLGVANVVFGLPLWVAVAHHFCALLLLLLLISTVFSFKGTARP